jgi:hypothetical protein
LRPGILDALFSIIFRIFVAIAIRNQSATPRRSVMLGGSPMSPGIVIANPRHSWMIINVNLQLQKIVDLTDVAAVQTALETRPWKAELFG